MARPFSPLPAQLSAAFSLDAARAAGVARGRLASRDLDVPFRGSRVQKAGLAQPPFLADASPITIEAARLRAEIATRARAYAQVAPEASIFSHVTAAVVWDMPVPIHVLRAGVENLDVARLGRLRAPRAAGVRGHQLHQETTGVRHHDGFTVTSPATTWVLLAERLSVDELVEVGDAVAYIPRRRGMQRGTPEDALATVDLLRVAMEAGRRGGIAKLREALPQIRTGSASAGETKIRLACMRAGLGEPELDVDLYAADGTPIGFTELAYREFHVLGEYEGDQHRLDRHQWNRDIDKHEACRKAGWDVVRLTSRHTRRNCQEAVAWMRAALVRNGWTPPTP